MIRKRIGQQKMPFLIPKKEGTQNETGENAQVNSEEKKIDSSEQVGGEQQQQGETKQVSNQGEDTQKKKTIRCKKWPQCKNESCEYAHPTETVKYLN